MAEPRTKVHYSLLSAFRNCREMATFRYIENLESLEPKARALDFGSLIHDGIKTYYKDGLDKALDFVDNQRLQRENDQQQMIDYVEAVVILRAYDEKYINDDFDIIDIEGEYECRIVNPDTMEVHPYTLVGRVDLVFKKRNNGKFHIMEHKTAARIDGSMIDRLWIDFQSQIYKLLVEEQLCQKVDSVVYNIVEKPGRMKPHKGETEEEYSVRCAELSAKNKKGTTTAKRKMPETIESFESRVGEAYRQEGKDKFHRESIYFGPEMDLLLKQELWELTSSFAFTQMMHSEYGVHPYRNTHFCNQFGRPCQYLPICRSGGSELLKKTMYRKIGEEPSIIELENDLDFDVEDEPLPF